MHRLRRAAALLIVLSAAFLLSGCGLWKRFDDWWTRPVYEDSKPDLRRRTSETPSEESREQPEPPSREDFRDYESKPLPTDDDALIDADFAPVRLKWMRRMSIDLYRDMGMRDGRWDSAAEALLDAYARYESDQPDAPSAGEFARLADEAVDAECPDPLVRMAAGVAYFHARRYADAKANVFRTDPRDAPDYPAMAIWPAEAIGWRSMSVLGPDEFDSVKPLHHAFAVKLGVGIRETEFEGAEARAAYRWIAKAIDEMHANGWEDLYNQVNDAVRVGERTGQEPDPWLVKTILGYIDLKRAYYSRGDGFADEVSERGAEGFEANLRAARGHLQEAWELHPEWPEPAALMVGVVTGEDGASPAGRAWFDRAIAGQIDYWPAWGRYIMQLMPRWGGSNEQLWELSRECIDTERYDTIVPWQAYNVARSIVLLDGGTEFVADPEVYSALARMCRAYLGARDAAVDEATVKTGWAALASAAGEHKEAVSLLDELGDDVDTTQLKNHFGRTPFGIRRQAALATSPQHQALHEAEDLRAAGDRKAAMEAFEAALSEALSAETERLVTGLLRAMEMEEKLAAGRSVTLVPGFAPEQCVEARGEWELSENGALLNQPRGDEQAELLFPLDIHDNYRLTAEIAFPANDDRVTAGLVFSAGHPNYGLQRGSEQFLADRYGDEMSVEGRRVSPSMERQMHVNRRIRLSAEVYRQTFSGRLDGALVFAGYPLMQWREKPELELVGLRIHYKGRVEEPVTIERLTLEPITELPPSWEDPGIRLRDLPRPWAGEMPEGVEPSWPQS